MTTIQSILPLLNRGAWMVTIDLKDAYFHIDIAPEHHRYLRFTLGHDHYQFRALPFGISSAPRVFTKFMLAIISHLHSKGITVFPYIDDWLLVANSVATLSKHLKLTLHLLHSLGVQVNWSKSHLEPCQRLQFIGAIIDSTAARTFLPTDRAQKLTAMITTLQSSRSQRAIYIQRLLGHMAAAIPVVPYVKLHMRLLQLDFQRQFKPHHHSQYH